MLPPAKAGGHPSCHRCTQLSAEQVGSQGRSLGCCHALVGKSTAYARFCLLTHTDHRLGQLLGGHNLFCDKIPNLLQNMTRSSLPKPTKLLPKLPELFCVKQNLLLLPAKHPSGISCSIFIFPTQPHRSKKHPRCCQTQRHLKAKHRSQALPKRFFLLCCFPFFVHFVFSSRRLFGHIVCPFLFGYSCSIKKHPLYLCKMNKLYPHSKKFICNYLHYLFSVL